MRVYDNADEMRAAASAYDPGVDLSECSACCQTAVWLNSDTQTLDRYGHRGYAGIIRLTEEHLDSEIVAHELVHAAIAVYRMNIRQDVRLGRHVTDREEALAYIYGELFADFETHFQRSQP